jgi:hypothetical protein
MDAADLWALLFPVAYCIRTDIRANSIDAQPYEITVAAVSFVPSSELQGPCSTACLQPPLSCVIPNLPPLVRPGLRSIASEQKAGIGLASSP